MIGKLHVSNGKKVFACCDKNLLNKSILFNGAKIEISEKFYGNQTITKKEFLENIADCDSANVFGKKVCDILVSKKIISRDCVLLVDKVPHVQIYNI
jgi:hypothetical protein